MQHTNSFVLYGLFFPLMFAAPALASETTGGALPYTAVSPTFHGKSMDTGVSVQPLNFNEATPDDVQTPACRTLSAENLHAIVDSDSRELINCFVELQKSFSGKIALATKKQRALNLPSAREKAFLGFVLTCYGEALPKHNLCDRQLIMLTVQNRARLCSEQDSKSYNALDIAFQPIQFSAFNPREYAKNPIFDINPAKPGPNAEHMRACIDAFRAFANSKYSDFKTAKETTSVFPNAEGTHILSGVREKVIQTNRAEANVPHLLVHYFAEYLTVKHKTPKWATGEWGRTAGISCSTPHGPETASSDHIAFADHWDCAKFFEPKSELEPEARGPRARRKGRS